MDRKLLDILACPATRQPLALLESRGLAALNAAILGGATHRIDDGIPVLLVEEGIATGQVADFPKG